jgi:hypothetical protein
MAGSGLGSVAKLRHEPSVPGVESPANAHGVSCAGQCHSFLADHADRTSGWHARETAIRGAPGMNQALVD